MRITLLLLSVLTGLSLSGQTVVCSRVADLVPGGYTIEGNAILQLMSDSTLRLSLDDDFTTPAGPDVQIFLSNDAQSVTNALFIADIGTGDGINHFSGAITFDVPSGTDIDQYSHIIFRCFAFNLHWAGGAFTVSDCAGSGGGGGTDTTAMMNNCIETTISATGQASTITICTNDGEDDIISFENSAGVAAGDRYAYIFTDLDDKILAVNTESSFNFEGDSASTIYVYGLSYEGNLTYTIGENITNIEADSCAILAEKASKITIVKQDCTEAFECASTATATTAWVTTLNICPTDGIADVVPLVNSSFLEVGDHFVYVVTDTLQRVQFIINRANFDFEGSGPLTQRVYGVSFSGELLYSIGEHFSTINATGCSILSDTSLYLSIYKDACPPIVPYTCNNSATATTDWVSEVSLCPNDGIADNVPLKKTSSDTVGAHYAFILTDEDLTVEKVIFDTLYNFEGSGLATQRVYGVSYDGNLMADIGQNLFTITATNCHILSDTSVYLSIFKTACPDTSDTGSLRGTVADYTGKPLRDVEIIVNGTTRTTTNASGRFDLSVPLGGNYDITANFNGTTLNGVRSSDIVLIQRHILGDTPFTNAFQSVAADVNFDGRVTVGDVVVIRNVLLGNQASFGDRGSWTFADGSQDYSNITSLKDISNTISIKNLQANSPALQIIAIKLGDVNASAE